MNDNFENEQNNFFLNDWKQMNKMSRSWTINEWNEKAERANLYQLAHGTH